MNDAFGKLIMRDVPPKLWHNTVAKLTVGHNGNEGPSGLQHPCVHLMDVFLGRTGYGSDLGRLASNARELLPSNHRRFLEAVHAGPDLKDFVRLVKAMATPESSSRLVDALRRVLDAYTTRGFLGVHRKKAFAYLKEGSAGQAERASTGGAALAALGTTGPDVSFPKLMWRNFTASLQERVDCGRQLLGKK